jgi:hypothetical protein
MRHRHASNWIAAGLLVAGSLAALPAAGEVYTIRLSNGTTFESRYQPKQAAWDPTFVTFLNEAGNEIALPQSLVVEVAAQSETKGYGRVLDTTTVDLGFMPNDLDQSQQLMRQQAMLNPAGQLVITPNAGGLFVEPSALGGGIPIGFTSTNTNFNAPLVNPGGGFVPASPGQGGTPPPFTTPTNTVTPPPFTTPSPTVAAPTTSPPQ